ncbi:sulfatase [Halobacterium sp. MBLA0001]|uniref:sulfatase n=1 Tax=Halobacterium sp. MBLA0001 TaxID=3413511 RepID=UPI003C7205A9
MSAVDNIIILSVDALRADHLGCYGYSRDTSPNIDKLAKDNAQFINAYSASSHTREAVPSLLTGEYPDEAVSESYHLNTTTIAEHLQDEGYQTGGFHSNPYVSRAYGFNNGFDKFYDDLHLAQNKLIALAQRALDKLRNRHYARASEINKKSLDWLDSLDSDQPFFLWNHYMDPHGPYEPIEEYRKQFHDESVSDRKAQKLYKQAIKNPESVTDKEQEKLLNLYDAEIQYTDNYIEKFFDKLEDRGLISESLIILTSDHGDLFGEHGYYEHPRYPFKELVHIPLIIIHPSYTDLRVETPVSSIDIVSSVLNQYTGTEPAIPGHRLLPANPSPDQEIKRDIVYAQASTTDNGTLYRRFAAFNQDNWKMVEYELVEEEVVASPPEPETSLERQLIDHAEKRIGRKQLTDEKNDSAAEEVNDRLEALGYKE